MCLDRRSWIASLNTIIRSCYLLYRIADYRSEFLRHFRSTELRFMQTAFGAIRSIQLFISVWSMAYTMSIFSIFQYFDTPTPYLGLARPCCRSMLWLQFVFFHSSCTVCIFLLHVSVDVRVVFAMVETCTFCFAYCCYHCMFVSLSVDCTIAWSVRCILVSIYSR